MPGAKAGPGAKQVIDLCFQRLRLVLVGRELRICEADCGISRWAASFRP